MASPIPHSLPWLVALIVAGLAVLAAPAPGAVEQSIYGDCKNGVGVLRVDADQGDGFGNPTYYAGTFKRGKLEGEGYQIHFGTAKKNDEVKLLQIAASGKLSRLKSLTGRALYVGEFVHGVRQGKGAWKRDLTGAFHGQTLLGEIAQGTFVNGQLSGPGVVRREYRGYPALGQVITYAGEFADGRLVRGSATVENGRQTGYIEGLGVDAERLNGWFTTNFRVNQANNELMLEPELFRAIYVDGRMIEESRRPAQSTPPAHVALPNGTYDGEVDEAGRPAGFGRMTYAESGRTYAYEGQVSNGRPNGYGHVRWQSNGDFSMGGYWFNGEMVSGVSFVARGGRSVLTIGRGDESAGPAGTFDRATTGGMRTGTAAVEEYTDQDGNHTRRERTEGAFVDGRKTGVFVTITSTGSRTEETFSHGQLTGFNGLKDFADLRLGDVVCVDGLLSLVESCGTQEATLYDGRVVTFRRGEKIEVCDVPRSRFYSTCPECRGRGFANIMIQPPDQQVIVTTYRREVIVGDFTILTTNVPTTSFVTKRPPPYPSISSCMTCAGHGRIVHARQLRKGE